MNYLRTTMAILASGLLAACGSTPTDDMPPLDPIPIQPVFEASTSGAIFRAGTEVRLYEDLRAGRVGDILTIRLIERTDASKNSQTQTAKTTAATLANPTVFGRPITNNGDPLFGGSIDSDTSFDGQGTSSQSNSLTGDITVTVIERQPNGNLIVQGEKWLTINQGREFVRVTGTVRPADIGTDNSVLSTRIANAQIAYSGKGVLNDANRMSILARFFNSILYP